MLVAKRALNVLIGIIGLKSHFARTCCPHSYSFGLLCAHVFERFDLWIMSSSVFVMSVKRHSVCELSNKFVQVLALTYPFYCPATCKFRGSINAPEKWANFVILDVFRVPSVTSQLSTVLYNLSAAYSFFTQVIKMIIIGPVNLADAVHHIGRTDCYQSKLNWEQPRFI